MFSFSRSVLCTDSAMHRTLMQPLLLHYITKITTLQCEAVTDSLALHCIAARCFSTLGASWLPSDGIQEALLMLNQNSEPQLRKSLIHKIDMIY